MDALTAEQLVELQLALQVLERELGDVHRASAEGAAPVDLDEPIGRLSRMDAMQQQSMVQANRAAMQRRLQQVRAALRRFDEDEYGVCAACGEEIGYGRLEAQPETPFCIGCQSAREQRA
jgi:DnaK suppressor protein